MRKEPPPFLERYRIWDGHLGSRPGDMHGAFAIKTAKGFDIVIISSGHDKKYGWEHVSVSLEHRAPTWEEMCTVKDLFWDDSEVVIQYHPKKDDYINCHPNCLHLWRPTRRNIPTPPTILVGPKSGAK
jgi:hypothetical protein